MRDACLLRRLSDTARHFVNNHVVMRSVPTEQAADADDSVILLRLRQRPRCGWNLKRSRHAHDLDVFLFCTRAQKSVIPALQKSLCDECIETRDDDRETFSRRTQAASEAAKLGFGAKLRAIIPIIGLPRDSVPPCWIRSHYPVFLCAPCGKALDLLPLECRQPLLQKCRCSFLLIFGRATHAKEHSLKV